MRRVSYFLPLAALIIFAHCSKIDDLGSRFFPKSGAAKAVGTVKGLAGLNLTLSVNSETGVIASSTAEIATSLKNGDSYTLAIAAQPQGPQQLCSFNSATTGVATEGVIPFAISCATGTHTVSGNVTGLTGTGLQLQLNGGEIIPVSTTSFSFAANITDGQAFNVQVKQQPSSPVQICTPEYNVGIVAAANITSVSILCSTVPYSVGGYVNGLSSGGSVTVQINGGQNTTRTSDGFFLFPTPLADQTHYDVTVLTQPTGQTCSVQSGSGALDGRGSYATYIQCSSAAWTVSGIVSGLDGGYVTLVTSAGEYKPVVANGAFSFSQKFANAGSYAVEVFRNPALPAQTCTVMNGTGTNITADIGSVSVTCSSTGYTIGGPVTGLTASGLVLRLNGTSDLIVPVGSSSYTFADSVASGGTYSVAVASQPTGLKCTVTPATQGGTVASANITGVAVTCQTGYTVSGTVTGLNGTNLVLRNSVNGGAGSDFVISGSSFTFPELLVNTDTYSVDIRNHPESPYQTCGISNSGGTIATANITNVSITCTNVTVQFQAASGNAAEANATIDIPITITPASARPLNLTLALAAGTAAAGVDFNFLTPTISIPVGATSVNAQIQVFQDSAYEPNETVIMNLTGVDKAALGTQANYTHTINNDDAVTATKVVVTNSGSNFTAGGTTNITVQVQDASSNLATTDNATQITFSPTGSAKISSVTTGTGDGGYGVAGGGETVTVSGGVATVVIANTVAQTFQIAITNNAALANPANIALTSSAGAATQVVITSAAPDTTAGSATSLTVQVQDANGNLVTGTSTLITFTPTGAGTVSGVTTGTGDGSYGVAAGAESVTVSGGIATITLTNNTAQTFQIAITNNGGLSNPANDSVIISPAAASQLVLTASGSNFITGGTTSLTLQVQDSFGNVRTADSSTQVTFSPTNSGKITAVGTGTGDGSYGVAGGAETITVAAGVATVTVGDAVSETFQVAFSNNGGLTNPSNRSLTASSSATQVAITQSGGSFILGNSTTLTVQVQTSGGSLVSSDNTTQVTFSPTNSGKITGVTTGTGDGSYGVVAGAETVTVSGGIATVTISDAVAETFQVAITNNAGLSNPANDSITSTAATGAVLTKAEYFDIDHNGKIDRVKLTFDKNVDETTLSGYSVGGTNVSTQFLIAGYSGVTAIHNQCIDESYPANGNCTDSGEVNDTTTNNIVWLQFTEGSLPDTGATPDLTGVDVSLKTTAAGGGCYIYTSGGTCNTQTSADFGTVAVAEADKAPPVVVSAWSDPVIDAWQLRIQFSEAVDLTSAVGCSGTVTSAAFTYNNVGGSGASALRTDFSDNNGCDSTNGYYNIIPRVNARFTMGDLKTDTLALATTFYDAVGLATVAATKTIQYDPNLELYYPIDANSPVSDTNVLAHDVTANARNGTVSNGAKTMKDMTDTNNQAYYFDGNDDRIVPASVPALGTGSFTVSSWIKFTDAVRTGRIHQIMYWGTAAANQRASFQVTAGKLKLELNGGASVTSTKYIADGWHHVAVTYTGGTAQLYIDGIADANGAMSSNLTANSPGVGYNPSSPTAETALGKLDEVRLYSRALSATEIKKLATKVPGGLVAQYPLEPGLDSANNTSFDISGNGNGVTIGSTTGSDSADPTPENSRYFTSGNATSYLFDGSADYMNATSTNINLANSNLSISGWFKRTASNASNNDLFVLGSSSNNQGLTLYINAGDALRCGFWGANETAGPLITDTNWHHAGCTYDAVTKTRNLYLDGALVASNIATSDFIGSTTLNVGKGPGSNLYFYGQINDIRFYNRALTAGEVAALATELDRGLVAYYPLDDAAATGKDYSGSANDLTASGGPTYTTDRNGTPNGAYSFASASSQSLTRSGLTGIPTGAAPRTICGWAKGDGSLGTTQSILSYGTHSLNSISGIGYSTSFQPMFSGFGGSFDIASPLSGTISNWIHMCGVHDSTTMKVYANGNQEAQLTNTMATSGTNMSIGTGAQGNYFMNGAIDDVRIYNRVLSLTEIRALSGFYPAHVANLGIWYDASRLGDTANTTPLDGSDASLWNDLSLNNRFADKSGSSATKPKYRTNVINGLSTIRFASGQRMDVNNFPRNLNTTAHTQLDVFRASGGLAGTITSQMSGVNVYLYNTGPVMQTGIGGSNITSNTPYTDNLFMIGGLTYANPSGTFYRNGLTDGSFSATAASNTNTWRLSDASSGLNGDVAEIVIYDRVLTAAELEKVNCYYSKKYAIAVTGLVCE